MQSDDVVCPECGSFDECEHDMDADDDGSIEQRKKGRDGGSSETPAVEMVTISHLDGPGEVFNTYGPSLSTAKLRAKYGFSVEANPWDRVEVQGGWIDADGRLSSDLWRHLGGTDELEAALDALEEREMDTSVRMEVLDMAGKVVRLCQARLAEMERPDLTTLELMELRDVSYFSIGEKCGADRLYGDIRRASLRRRDGPWTRPSDRGCCWMLAGENGPCTPRC
jgi:hypothetical protein